MSSDNCENKVTVYHEDPKVIERIIKAYERGTLLDEFTRKTWKQVTSALQSSPQ